MTKKTLNRVFFRSFFLQGTWNFERMQNLGFCFSILPALRNIYATEEELKNSVKRHLEFFNTQPYMAAPVLGAATRMEEEAKKGTISPEDIKTFKTTIMGPYGAIGDSFFWGSFKPLVSVIAVCLAACGQILAPLLFLLIYNIPHLKIRYYGFYTGYQNGMNVFEIVNSFNFTAINRKVKVIINCFSGLLLAALVGLTLDSPLTGGAVFEGVIYLCFFYILFLAYNRGISTTILVYIAFILCTGSAFLYS